MRIKCSKPCGTGSRTRVVLCLSNNQTSELSKCGAGSIPFGEEKCNPAACPDDADADADADAVTTTPPEDDLVEVCEEVEDYETEYDDSGSGEEAIMEGSGDADASGTVRFTCTNCF